MSDRNSLVVQWLGLCSTAGGPGSIPGGWGGGGETKILYMMWHGQKIKANFKECQIDVLAAASLYKVV